MGRSSRGMAPLPSTRQVLEQDLQHLMDRLFAGIEDLMDWVFEITPKGARRRQLATLLISIVLWTGWALYRQPIRWTSISTEPILVLTDLVRAYFSADIIRHVVVVLLGHWLAFQVAAIYLDDVFELSDTSVAQRFINQAAFGGRYNAISIREGAIGPESLNSPVTRIGGPGVVGVHLENVAVFEKISGRPHIIGPQSPSSILEGFERLREVIDLRDQILVTNIRGRTQDGIHVTAKDIRLIYSVYSGPSGPFHSRRYSQAYYYTNQAVLNLVYKQGTKPLNQTIETLIQRQLRDFIAQHTLNEFLALQIPPGSPRTFVPRDEITARFYSWFNQSAPVFGVEIQWIGVGTWETPSEIISDQQLDAWKADAKNRTLGSKKALNQLHQMSRSQQLLYNLREEVITNYNELQIQGASPAETKGKLLVAYRMLLQKAKLVYQKNGQTPPPKLIEVLRFLSFFTLRWMT